MVLMALAGGSLAFALAQFVGRGAGAGIAGFVTIAGFIVNGYQAPVPELAPDRQPDLVRLDGQPPAAGRPVRLAVGRLPGCFRRDPAGHRRVGLRATRHGRHQFGPDALAPASAWLACAAR